MGACLINLPAAGRTAKKPALARAPAFKLAGPSSCLVWCDTVRWFLSDPAVCSPLSGGRQVPGTGALYPDSTWRGPSPTLPRLQRDQKRPPPAHRRPPPLSPVWVPWLELGE